MTKFDKQAIKRLRKEKGLSLSEFGRPLGMRPQQVRVLEQSIGYPNVRTIERIMDAYEVDHDYFFSKKHNIN